MKPSNNYIEIKTIPIVDNHVVKRANELKNVRPYEVVANGDFTDQKVGSIIHALPSMTLTAQGKLYIDVKNILY